MEQSTWRHCGTCKKAILLDSLYLACGVSTCRKSTYCSLECFDAHVPVMRHKEGWAEERRAPKTNDSVVDSPNVVGKDILIVASKLKDYISAKSGMNTSGNVTARLSDIVRMQCDRAIERARQEGRKTVMDRDFII